MPKPIILFALAVLLFGCDHPRPNKIKDVQKSLAESKKIQANIDSTGEEINLAKPILISDEWLNKAWKYNGKRLPKLLRELVEITQYDKDTNFVNYNNNTFFIEKAQLDQDSIEEIMIFISHERLGTVGIIKNIWNKWYLISRTTEGAHYSYPEKPVIDTLNKLIIERDENWGTFISGNDLTFYKLINNKLYDVFEYSKDMYIGIFEEGDLVHNTEATHTLYKNGQAIKVTYSYSLYKQIETKGGELNADFYILKDQKLSLEYGWDSTSNKYKIKSAYPFKESKYSEYIGPDDFYDLYLDIIKYISQHGTKKQRKALAYLNKKPNHD